jgi:hypothetical protein
MSPSSKKIIIRIGFGLLAMAFFALTIVAFVSMLEGVGGIPIGYRLAGRQSVFIGVTYISVFLVAIMVLFICIWNFFQKFWISKNHSK